MKQEEIKEMSTEDLKERLEAEEKQLVRLKLNHAVSPLENPLKIREYRRMIARIKTELGARELKVDKQKSES
ncbi:MAG: 50S ribosomal protein L29 [Bacteroidales bacterium]|nr:50S ribosomal protein L29 [Bacteroidales bacterium]